MSTIAQCLTSANLNRIDAEVLLAFSLSVDRSYLYTYPEKEIDDSAFQALLERRLSGEPVAYITGVKEFWGLAFKVTKDVLVPRPETELLVEQALKTLDAKTSVTLADLGTGSGAIALSLAHEKPNWQVIATDQSNAALKLAKYNQKKLNIENVTFYQGSWCEALPDMQFDCIVSNPPYIDENDAHLDVGDVRFEPRSALVSSKQGLHDIECIALQAKHYLKPGGILLLEHGYDQSQLVQAFLKQQGYRDITKFEDLAGHDRALLCKFP